MYESQQHMAFSLSISLPRGLARNVACFNIGECLATQHNFNCLVERL